MFAALEWLPEEQASLSYMPAAKLASKDVCTAGKFPGSQMLNPKTGIEYKNKSNKMLGKNLKG